MTDKSKSNKTHFGFKIISKEDKIDKVSNVFHSVAKKYDMMNDIISFGLHRIWKKIAIDMSGVCNGYNVLDVAGGTGDLTKKFSSLVGQNGHVVLVDINSSMLDVGRVKLRDLGILGNISYVQANAERLPFLKNSFNCVTISFGLRNLTNKDEALKSMFNVLKPGGCLIILEFSKPQCDFFRKIYDIYSFYFVPYIGKLVTNDSESYQYLVESIRMHPTQEILKNMMQTAGFENIDYVNISGGIVALHRGFKF